MAHGLDPIARSRSVVYKSGLGHAEVPEGPTWCKPPRYKGAIFLREIRVASNLVIQLGLAMG